MSGRKRVRYEFTGDEDEVYQKCMRCKHSYVLKTQSDELRCSCKSGCRFKEDETQKVR